MSEEMWVLETSGDGWTQCFKPTETTPWPAARTQMTLNSLGQSASNRLQQHLHRDNKSPPSLSNMSSQAPTPHCTADPSGSHQRCRSQGSRLSEHWPTPLVVPAASLNPWPPPLSIIQ